MASNRKSQALGAGIVIAGAFMLMGSVTGTLAAMLAALFDSSILCSPPKQTANVLPFAPLLLPSITAGSGAEPVVSPSSGSASATEPEPSEGGGSLDIPGEGETPIIEPTPASGGIGPTGPYVPGGTPYVPEGPAPIEVPLPIGIP